MDKEKRLAAARKKLQEYKKARGGELAIGSGGPVGKDPLETAPPICGNSSSSGSDSSMIIINPQYVLDNNGSHNFGSALSGPQESDLEIISTPSPSLANDDSKVASQQQSSSSSSFADENSTVNSNQNENTVGETLTSMPDAYGAPHSTTSSVPDSENEQFVFLNPPSGQELHEIPLYHPQSVSSIGIQLPQLYPQSYGNSEITDNVEMHTFAHNYNPPPQQGYSSSSFTPVSVTEGNQSPQIPMYSVPSKTENEPQQPLIQVPPQPMFYDPNSMNVTTTTSYPPISSENSMASSEPPNAHPYYMSYYQQQQQQPATSAQPVVSDPLTVNSPYFYPQETTPSVILQPSVPQVQFVDIHPQVLSRPSSRKSNRSQELDDKDDKESIRALQKMQSVQDALELQMEELSRDNSRLLNRQTELLSQLQENEKTIHELRRERDYSKEEAKKSLQPLHAKVNALYEENQRAMKTAGDQYNELMGRLEEKTKQFVDMEQAFIVVSQSKMEFAAQLDQERERWKESEIIMEAKDEEIRSLKESSAKIEEKLKSELQKDAAVQQLEDQRRHFQVQCETLFAELSQARIRIKTLEQQLQTVPTAQAHVQTNQSDHSPHHHPQEQEHHSDHSHHDHGTGDHSPAHSDNHHQIQDDHHGHSHSHDNEHGHSHDDGHGHSHGHDDGHEHSHDDGHGHSHGHDDGHGHSHGHDDGHGHSHSHDDGHGHSHSHGDEHGHEHSHGSETSKETHKESKPMSLEKELTELKKTLLRMEWENKTYRTELDRLAVDAKAKQMFENNYNALKVESDKAKEEIGRLEHLVIQLQGENDTIGDYITLYQSQRMALRERAKEKDVQIENLAKEREGLLHKMSELNQLLKELKFNTNLGGAAGAGTESSVHAHYHPQQQQSVVPQQSAQQQQQIEGKIINLITEISSSSLIENFHPCAVCSGRLMTV